MSDTGRARKNLIIYQYKLFGLKKLKNSGISTEDLEGLLSREELQDLEQNPSISEHLK